MENHKKELDKSKTNLLLGQPSIQLTPTGLKSESVFTRQKAVDRSIAFDLCARGGLPLTLCEKPYFRDFMNKCQPRFDQMPATIRSNQLS